MPLNIDPAGARPPGRQLRQVLACLALLACTATGIACSKTETRFEIVAFHEGTAARRLSEHFDEGRFSRNAHRALTLVFEVHDESPGEAQPPDERGPQPPTTQIVTIQVFWEPRPGTTYAESSQTNATIGYCLISGPDSIRYSGAGFVYLSKVEAGRIEGRIESSALKVAQVVGSPRDLFGRCRIQGSFAATEDRQMVIAKQLRIRRLFGAPGLHQAPQPSMDLPLED